jgi:broad specificity phosphatase PhoE
VRHGPTHEKAFTGWRDVPADLSDGDAVARLDAHLPKSALVVASDLSRASATADVLSAGRRRLPDDPRLREFDFGAWDGLTSDAVAARDPELSRIFWEQPGTIAPPGGECWDAVAARVADAIASLSRDHPGADLVAVAHLGVIMAHLGTQAGLGARAALGHMIEPLSVTRLDRDGAGWRAVSINHRA